MNNDWQNEIRVLGRDFLIPSRRTEAIIRNTAEIGIRKNKDDLAMYQMAWKQLIKVIKKNLATA